MPTAFDEVCELCYRLQSGVPLEALWIKSLLWRDIVKSSAGHGVLAFIATELRGKTLANTTGDYEALLSEYPRRVRAKNKFLAQELRRIQQVLSREGIQSLTFKGPALAASAYGGLDRRTCSDIDLLISPEPFVEVARILGGEGYALNTYMRGSMHQRIQRYLNHQYTFTRGRAVFHLDIHTAITSPRHGYAPSFAELKSRSREVCAEGIQLASLSPEDMLLAGCYQGLKDRWRKLKHVLDIDQLVRSSEIRWPSVTTRAHDSQSVRALFVGLSLAHRLLNTPLPPELVLQMEQDSATQKVCDWAEGALRAWPEEPIEPLWDRIQLYTNVQDNLSGVLRYSVVGALRKVWHLYEQAYLARQ